MVTTPHRAEDGTQCAAIKAHLASITHAPAAPCAFLLSSFALRYRCTSAIAGTGGYEDPNRPPHPRPGLHPPRAAALPPPAPLISPSGGARVAILPTFVSRKKITTAGAARSSWESTDHSVAPRYVLSHFLTPPSHAIAYMVRDTLKG